jgi:hypothetical protein
MWLEWGKVGIHAQFWRRNLLRTIHMDDGKCDWTMENATERQYQDPYQDICSDGGRGMELVQDRVKWRTLACALLNSSSANVVFVMFTSLY